MALSLWQPWATLIALGVKRYETRSWSTGYRGPIAIHRWTRRMSAETAKEPYTSALRRHGYAVGVWDSDAPFRLELEPDQKPAPRRWGLPLGAVVAVAELVSVRPTREVLRELCGGDDERAFGDFRHGRWAWEYEDVVRIEPPVPCAGQQGLFTVPDDARSLLATRYALLATDGGRT